ncbi:hypothetical protein D3C77_149180 [compost metagenome]
MKIIKYIMSLMLLVTMVGCTESPDKSAVLKGEVDSGELRSFVAGVIDNLVYVEGGSFLMGVAGNLDRMDFSTMVMPIASRSMRLI